MVATGGRRNENSGIFNKRKTWRIGNRGISGVMKIIIVA